MVKTSLGTVETVPTISIETVIWDNRVHHRCRHGFNRARAKEWVPMKNYEVGNIQLKRFYLSNRLYFITTVTEDRVPIFSNEQNIRLLFGAISEFSHRYYMNGEDVMIPISEVSW